MKIKFLFLVLFASAVSFGAPSVEGDAALPAYHAVEVGLQTGYPAAFGITLGYWNPDDKFPYVARLSAGIGSQMDLGFRMSTGSDPFRKAIALSAGLFGYHDFSNPKVDFFLGPSLIGQYKFITVQLGPAFMNSHPNASGVRESSIFFQAQVGFSWVH